MTTWLILGRTCAGKTTLVNAGAQAGMGTIQVGKLLREKYPPEHFQGRGAPPHTQAEALNLLEDHLALTKQYQHVLIDGQPRAPGHTYCALTRIERARKGPIIGLHLTAPQEVLTARARERFADNPEGFALATARFNNDLIDLYEVLMELRGFDIDVYDVDTSVPAYAPAVMTGYMARYPMDGALNKHLRILQQEYTDVLRRNCFAL